jgi:hypothetical protein
MREVRFYVICKYCSAEYEIVWDADNPTVWAFMQDHVGRAFGYCTEGCSILGRGGMKDNILKQRVYKYGEPGFMSVFKQNMDDATRYCQEVDFDEC